MAKLSLSLLGPFQMTLNGRRVTSFKSNKVRALLAYLAVESDRPHRREVLAGLLWPDWPDRDALSNLRYALSNLRQVIRDREAAPPFLLITRNTLQFNTASDHWLDVGAFSELAAVDDGDASAVNRWEEAVALYRGGFLEGFSLDDSPVFEEWALFTREHMARQVSSVLHRLAGAHEQAGDYEKAQSYAWKQLELEPWDEAAHCQLMRSLTLSGQRGAALAQYETCCRVLAEELGVEPGPETTQVYEQIRDGTIHGRADEEAYRAEVTAASTPKRAAVAVEPPPFLVEKQTGETERPVFVAREPELLRLDGFLELALAGRGRVVFVTGDAGSGKTALVQAFARRAQDRHAKLLVAAGTCNAYTGIGDPYSPFRQILGLLTGDVEAGWAAGVITRERARRLWHALPLTVRAMVEHGPDLIDTFIPRGALLDRSTTFGQTPLENGRGDASSDGRRWLIHLNELLARSPHGPGAAGPQQLAIFEQYTRVLQAVARDVPLVLFLDDVQWADAGSINLLFHLGRQLVGSRILVLGAYRPEEVALGRRGERHPLDPVVNEFRRMFGDTEVDLGQTERWHFLEALLDNEPNQLGPAFREMLYRQTRGHPLFTIELLRGLQERGDLQQDGKGRWVEGPTLDWETLPARVEAVVAERISRLAPRLQAALRVASVEGETFTAEVVAQVQGIDEQAMLTRLSAELDRGHRLIRAESIQRVDGQLLSRYRFRHILFQKYLYGSMDKVERVHLHEQVGTALERLYGVEDQGGPMAVQLALHFERARITEKAVQYLQRAGDQATRVSAYREAASHLVRALALLRSLPDPGRENLRLERAEAELALQVSLTMARMGGIPSPEWQEAVTRARELSQRMGKMPQLCRVVGQMSILHYVRAEYQKARELAQEALSLAQQTDDPLLVMLGHWYLGFITFGLGEYATARAHLERVTAFYDPEEHHSAFLLLRGSDPGMSALAYHASCLWSLGYPDQAAKESREALALARRLDHPFSSADVICFGGCVLNQLRRDAPALKEDAEELMRLSQGLSFSSWLGAGTGYWGEALVQLGQVEEGIEQMRQSVAMMESMGARCYLSGTLGALGQTLAGAGRLEEAAAALADAFAFVEESDERYYEVELRRRWGELLLAQGEEPEAEASLLEAVEVARRQHARSLELRATVSLCRLWQEQGRREEARERLAPIYGWFTEGFETPDLVEARDLLQELERR